MSQTLSPDPISKPLDLQVKQITDNAFRHIQEGTATNREIAIAIEANQKYVEYLDFVKDNSPPSDSTITIEVDGTQIKFKNEDDFADWLQEQMP